MEKKLQEGCHVARVAHILKALGLLLHYLGRGGFLCLDRSLVVLELCEAGSLQIDR
jgi:hypothetical protein